MSIDYYSCHNCGETFPDVIDYVYCETCGMHWCSEECAEEDGFVREHCSKYDIYGYSDMEDERITRECEKSCCAYECEFYIPDSCKMCRGEDYEDNELLEKALQLLQITREDLIKKMKE